VNASLFSTKARISIAILLLLFLLAGFNASHAGTGKKKGAKTPIQVSLDEYLKRVRAAGEAQPDTVGSLFIASALLPTSATDYKAHRAGDLIIVRLVDKFQADSSGENKTQRAFSANSGVSGSLFANNSNLQNILTMNSAQSLDGKGAATLSSDLQLVLAGQVMEVLPNGVMVIQAARDFTVGNDRQTVIVRGLVRPGDVADDNSILSSAIANVELQVKGKGEVADAMRRPNLVVRLLMRFFSF
jgi:flagellar L-ring protein FlgH